MPKIIFLGTGSGTACVSKQIRGSGGIVIQFQDLQFHLDPGPGSLNKAKEIGLQLQHNTAILVSHNHINHCNDLNVIIDAMTHGGIEHRGIVLASKSVLHDLDNSRPILTKHHAKLVEKIIPMEKDHKVGIELVEIHALPVKHTDPTAIGFKFYFPKFTLAYTGDTMVTPDLLESLSGTDVLILNVPYPGDKGQGGNLDREGAIKIISHVRPRLAIMTHFSWDMLKADCLQEAREVQRITGVQTIAAQDGLVISPDGYDKYRSPVKGYD